MSEVALPGERPGSVSWGLALTLIAAAAVILFPPLSGYQDYLLYNAGLAAVYVILATGYNILIGMTGQLAMSQVAFYGIGAYVSALLTRDTGVNWAFSLLLAMAVPTFWAWVMARGAVRFTGPYLAMITFAFHSMVVALFINWTEITNGWGGVMRIPPLRVGDFAFSNATRSYYLLAAVAALGLFIAVRIRASRHGRALFAIRENRLAAKGVGIDTTAYITLAFCISGAYAGLAGGLLAHTVRYIDPTSFGLSTLVDLLIIIIVGGRGSVMGVAISAVCFVTALEYLRFLQDWKLIIFGLLLVVLINVSPDGVGPLAEKVLRRIKSAAVRP
jgi:branched-chain amino acid transport system permease protein